jgi:polyhydroxyalkanoate synthesis regulator phasin
MKKYSVSVDRTSFYVEVEARNEEEAKQVVQRLLEQGSCTNEEDETYYEIGNDIEEVDSAKTIYDQEALQREAEVNGAEIWNNER